MGYRLLDPVTNHVVASRNVQFNEEKKKCISIQDGFSIEGKDLAKEEVIPDPSDAESKSMDESYEENIRQRRNIYAAVISTSSLRLVLAIIIQKNLEIYAIDVKTAFLNSDLQETIYMEQPIGYNDNSGRVCKLLKSLYGLKQAHRQWFKRFTNFIIRLNFQQLNCEACIFVRRSKKSEIFIVLYVDGLLIAGSDDSEVGVVIQLLRNEFGMSKTEVANEFLGISFEYSHNKFPLGQKAYAEKILNKFRMVDCKLSGTPLVPSTSSNFVNGERFHGSIVNL
ncbi:Copia protein [Araneus ventricosus]|uniref:Copia protein n=1 Tax=Araneus ventricosus TaxID=182803 RepID=A0A4Y2C3I8_ARAVE|nr:Copia protein [Araneus ventricosus]